MDPRQIGVDKSGNIYVADSSNNRIEVFAPDGSFGTKWGTFGTGPGQFNTPTGVGVDQQGNVFVFDTSNCRIQKFGGVTPTRATSWGQIKTLYR